MSSSIFILWNKINVSNRWGSYQILCVFLFYLCPSWWSMFSWSPVEKLSDVIFKFLWTIILIFWNRVLKIENQIFAESWIYTFSKAKKFLKNYFYSNQICSKAINVHIRDFTQGGVGPIKFYGRLVFSVVCLWNLFDFLVGAQFFVPDVNLLNLA